jgi:uroporphyrinogen decarboxylase
VTPRERVFRALEFRNPDRAPRDLWALPWVGMFAPEPFSDLLRDYPGDFTGPGAVLASGERRRGEEARKGSYVDDWGCAFDVAEDGVIGEVRNPILDSLRAIEAYRPPREIMEQADWDAVSRARDANTGEEARFLTCGTGIRPFERMQFLRGSENLYMDLGYGSKELQALLKLIHEFELELLAKWVQTPADGLGFMDDWGSQTGLLISPEMWREIFKPMYAKYCRMIRAAGKKVFFHSDGHIFDIYEDLIEIGVDAVNSQLFCMDIEEIARRFKGRITFWGEIDRQHVLPFGSTEDVRRAVGRVRRALDDGRGGLIAQCEWGVANPPENIRTVYKAWLEPTNALPRD